MTSFSLILSGAYVDQELAIEFGRIPPSFLPIGVTRLYETQIKALSKLGSVYLTLPEDFNVPHYDMQRLEELGAIIVRVPNHLSLGNSIIYALNYIETSAETLHLLHGDTLVEGLDLEQVDALAVHHESDDYAWASVSIQKDNTVSDLQAIQLEATPPQPQHIICGYFCFSKSRHLVRALTRAGGSFIKGIALYAKEHTLKAIYPEKWYDFGHLQTYFRSRRSVTTQRAFNSLYIDDRIVRKSSDDHKKMHDEATWLQNVPADIKPFTARLLDTSENSYTIEYEYAPTLSELFVFSSIGKATWESILESCFEFLSICQKHSTPEIKGNDILKRLATDKTYDRIAQYSKVTGFDINHPLTLDGKKLPSLKQIADEMISNIDLSSDRNASIMHGDFCLSNILYNSRARRICTIDPRGYIPVTGSSIFGDIRYDFAKLWHSFGGLYDLIIAGHYLFEAETPYNFSISFPSGPHHEWVQADFLRRLPNNISKTEVNSLTVLLFISMLPLHADRPDRQKAFIANAARLYQLI
ncbi:capsular biosynthesis protein [Acetobacter oryzifermentans]|uniref:capsular biosynthesis protein n=1 Tax=Acetobacter oryzifermentans TaxID=1633874 RepID=UPI0039BF36A6